MLDAKRLADPDWFCSNQLMGMMLYGNAFARNLKSVREKLSYLEEYGVNYLHLMSFLASPKGRSDGGYAVADFRTVLPESEAMDDLESLADDCREKGISLCLDFVMNHTSENHAWTKAAREGDQLAKSRYFFYDNWDEPDRYEQTAPQIFSAAAPGNFTWQEDCGKVVMTTFYPLRQHRPALRDQQVGCHGSAQNSYTPPAGVIISRLWVFFVGMWIIRAPRQRIRPATEGSSISISVICSCFRHL